MREPDAAFADPRLAALYDILETDRSDLDSYVAIAEEVQARTVVDIGCGTGAFVLQLAELGMRAVGVDPATASLDVARAKPHAGRVTWVDGDATVVVGLQPAADLAVMTANVAQVFVSDEDWHRTLDAVHACLRPHGWFAFETRRPEARAWEDWDVPPRTVERPDGSSAVVSRTVREVTLPLVTFESVAVIDGEVLPSTSTLRFRERAEVVSDLESHGFSVTDIRDAPDRLGKEFVFLARRSEL